MNKLIDVAFASESEKIAADEWLNREGAIKEGRWELS